MELIANKTVVEQELKRARRSRHGNQRNTVLLLRAAPVWRGDPEFTFEDDGTQIPVTVAPCPTVLSVLAALSADRPVGRYLVMLTPCDTRTVGESVLARAIRTEVKPVNRWDLVQDAFGALRLDPLLWRTENRWIAEALLDAQPAGGWRRLAGPVLTRDAALNRLAATRLGIEDAGDGPIDAAALLQWTTDATAVAGFRQLRAEEHTELTGWLKETAGAVADVVFRMGLLGRITDAVPFGLAVAALYASPEEEPERVDGTLAARIRAEERYLGGNSPGDKVLRTFGEAAESLITRWTGNGHAARAAALCERADVILGELAGNEENKLLLAGRSRVLETGLDARLTTLADAIVRFLSASSAPPPDTLLAAEEALDAVTRHARSRDHDAELWAARSAVHLMHWLAAAEDAPSTLTDAATRMIRSWGWVDRALSAIERADTSRVPRLAEAYARLWAQARGRRTSLDDALSRKFAAWTENGSATDLLRMENVLERIARPLTAKRLPVIAILDGMSVAAATALADEVTVRGTWLEAGRQADGREPVLATAPSITALSPTGFGEFWGKRKSVLFQKTDLVPEPGRPLAVKVRDAIADTDTVVGAALNTIDDAVDETATYLGPIMDEARRAGRPVILTVGHASAVEVVLPVIVLLPSESLLPADWFAYDRNGHAPAWWSAAQPARTEAPWQPRPSPRPAPSRRKRQPTPASDDDAVLFSIGDAAATAAPAMSVGAQVVASPRMASQRQLLRRPPSDTSITALIDALIEAGNRLTLPEAATAVGEPPVRMSGYLAQVTRLLNVDGYPVVRQADGGRTITLTPKYLHQQFLGE